MATTRLSIRIDLASGDRIGPSKMALLEMSTAARSCWSRRSTPRCAGRLSQP
jgi:hypothetical protein